MFMDVPTAVPSPAPAPAAPPAAAPAAKTFRAEVLSHLVPLRTSLRKLILELGSPRTPTLLQRKLNVAYTICWQIFRFVGSEDMSAEAQHAPSPGSLKRLLQVSLDAGVKPATVEAVQLAADRYEAFIQSNAEDRTAFNSMVVSTTSEPKAKKVLLQRRRAAYRAMSHVWGVQTDFYCYTALMRRDETGKGLHVAWLSLQQGVRRLSASAQVTLAGYILSPNPNGGPPEGLPDALDPDAATKYGMPILPDFSSKPIPQIETVSLPSGIHLFNMVGSELGLRSNFDFTSGFHQHRSAWREETDGRRFAFLNFVNTRKPAAMVVMDLILHREDFPNVRVGQMVHQYIDGDQSLEAARAAQQFPIDERIKAEGPAHAADLAETPRYPELLQFAAERLGWSLADFDLYRLRIPYPIMGTATRMYFYDPKQ